MSTPVDMVRSRTTRSTRGSGRKLLFLVTEDWYFCSHRLPVARAARDAGYEVVVATRVGQHGDRIEREGFRLVPLRWRRGSINPLREIPALGGIIALYRREKPDLVHHVALKPALYGSIAARFAGAPPSVNMVAGLGYVFTARGFKPRVIASVVRGALRRILARDNARILLQNPDDRKLLASLCRGREDQLVMIRGSGVDVEVFRPAPEPPTPVVTLIARMLWNKGIDDLVAASRILVGRNQPVKVRVVGMPDPENHSSIPEQQLEAWEKEGLIEWCRHRDDVAEIWASTSIAVLPTTYGEGVPKALIEAAATARPIIATDTPGCREIVRQGENGLLIPVHDPTALADAIASLIRDPELRRAMGMRGRRLVEEEFSEAVVVRQTLELYNSLCPVHAG